MNWLLGAGLALAVIANTTDVSACFSCANWTTWGERELLCRVPSEILWDDLLACLQTGCAADCEAWLADYDACEASSASSCSPAMATDDCNNCVYGACDPEAEACSTDSTGCVPCADWLAGGNPANLCPGAPIAASIQLGMCACAACPASCGAACALGYLDISQATHGCEHCFATACTADVSACEAL